MPDLISYIIYLEELKGFTLSGAFCGYNSAAKLFNLNSQIN
jgi:hypothetical protein